MGSEKSGNFSKTRASLFANAGNRSPLGYRDVSRSFIENNAIPQYNAEATYNDWANHKAAGHLNELNQHLSNLAEVTKGHPAGRDVEDLKYDAQDAHETMSKVGFAAHPAVMKPVHNIGEDLGSIKYADIPATALPHLHGAITAAANFANTFEPARTSTYTDRSKNKVQDPNRTSMILDSGYRLNINADEKTADGRYRKTAQYEAAKKAKGYKKPAKKAAN